MPAEARPNPNAPWTLGQLRDWTAGHFAKQCVEFPRLDAEVLLAHVVGCKRIDLYVRNEEIASDSVRAKYKELIGKRLEGCPVAYLVGKKEFFSLEFEVGPGVLIPRPDTETLVTACLELAKPLAAPAVLDVGTGSGAIAVAIAKNHPGAKLTAIDISSDALAIAGRNVARHGLTERIRLLRGDLFSPLGAEERFDFILSNPPYIPREDLPKLPVGVRQYEPALALDGGPGAYEVVSRLIAAAGTHLKLGGHLLVEIGADQETPVRELFQRQPGFELGPTIRDFSRRPRVLRARWAG
jgi:release factor glutamine methyltransferase